MLSKYSRFKKMSDEQLMAAIKDGKKAAFDELYERYSRRLLNYFYRMLGYNADDAQDFLHSLFVKILEKPQRFNREFAFQSWIFSIAHNMCKNEYRRRKVRLNFEQTTQLNAVPEDRSQLLDQAIDHDYFEAALNKELETLDPEQRSVFTLRFQEKLAIKDIRQVTGCAEGTVKSRLFYTTKKLADRLKEFHPYKNEASQNGRF